MVTNGVLVSLTLLAIKIERKLTVSKYAHSTDFYSSVDMIISLLWASPSKLVTQTDFGEGLNHL